MCSSFLSAMQQPDGDPQTLCFSAGRRKQHGAESERRLGHRKSLCATESFKPTQHTLPVFETE